MGGTAGSKKQTGAILIAGTEKRQQERQEHMAQSVYYSTYLMLLFAWPPLDTHEGLFDSSFVIPSIISYWQRVGSYNSYHAIYRGNTSELVGVFHWSLLLEFVCLAL